MRIRRALIIPAILTLGVAGSALIGAAIHPSAAHPHVAAASAKPGTYYRA